MKAKAKGADRRVKLTLTAEEADALVQELHRAWERAGSWSKLGEHLSELDDVLQDFLDGADVYPLVRGAE